MAEQGYIIDYKVAVDEFCRFMQRNGNNFVPSLYERLDFVDYYNKITNNGNLIACRNNDDIVGIICFYCNDFAQALAYVALLAVDIDYQGRGLASLLLNEAVKLSRDAGMKQIHIHTNNELAYQCYIKSGFTLIDYKSMNNYNRYHLIKVL